MASVSRRHREVLKEAGVVQKKRRRTTVKRNFTSSSGSCQSGWWTLTPTLYTILKSTEISREVQPETSSEIWSYKYCMCLDGGTVLHVICTAAAVEMTLHTA
ncbi:uncharacterized protein LOC111188191 isoform X1 [Astyanax mexicanus]|uniref:uncharacterized protein LOC111188191 isoform X1 n=1 Tax=Astyanax mexicanus TaxID=7994 RepID=UPI0020CAC30A|nr:uncharacterized protein LOC111188191 isoform X1 [Astyanax mexicanus]